MNPLFDSRRFGKYFAYQARTGWKKYATYLGALLLAILFILVVAGITIYENYYDGTINTYGYSSSLSDDPMWSMEMGWFWFAIFLATAISASFTFGELASKNGRIFSLMVPASQLEKYLTNWLILCPVTLVLLLVGLEAVDAIRCLVLSMVYPDSNDIHFLGMNLFDFDTVGCKILIACLLFTQSINVLGSSIWPKNALVKTFIAVAVIVIINSMLGSLLAFMTLENDKYFYGEGTVFDKSDFSLENYILCMSVVMAVVNYVVAYFRYREIEIVQRW